MTVKISDAPPRFEFQHRHCDDPTAYLSKDDREKLEREVAARTSSG